MTVAAVADDMTLGEFLRVRRARLRPDELGLREFGRRRVPGLRREEVAELAGMSSSYYTRIEQGAVRTPSPAVLEALARALRFDDDERSHLQRLAEPPPRAARAADPMERPSDSLSNLVHALTVPCVVLGRALDVLDWNEAGRVLLPNDDATAGSLGRPMNWANLVFLSGGPHVEFLDRLGTQRETAGYLRLQVGRRPGDPRLAEVVSTLRNDSSDFRSAWQRHEVSELRPRTVRVALPTEQRLTLRREVLRPVHEDDQLVLLFSPVTDATPRGASSGRSHVPRGSARGVRSSTHARPR